MITSELSLVQPFFPPGSWLKNIQKAPGLTGIHAARWLNCFKTRALPAVPILCRSLWFLVFVPLARFGFKGSFIFSKIICMLHINAYIVMSHTYI